MAGEGPNYRSGQPETGNLNPRGEVGFKLWLRGQVFDRNKQPLASARVDAWQVDQKGSYNLTSDDYHGHGYQLTDALGAFCFETLRPPPIYAPDGSYHNIAHIHLKVWVDDVVIQTYQLYFDDDPAHEFEDMYLAEDLIKTVEVLSEDEGRVRLDLVLPYPATG